MLRRILAVNVAIPVVFVISALSVLVQQHPETALVATACAIIATVALAMALVHLILLAGVWKARRWAVVSVPVVTLLEASLLGFFVVIPTMRDVQNGVNSPAIFYAFSWSVFVFSLCLIGAACAAIMGNE